MKSKQSPIEFLKTIVVPLKAGRINLRDFFSQHFIDGDFKDALYEATSDTVSVSKNSTLQYEMHRQVLKLDYTEILNLFGEKIIDLGTIEGRQEACKRFHALAQLLIKSPKGHLSELRTKDHYGVIIGWMKLKNGSIVEVFVCWEGKWYWDAYGAGALNIGYDFLIPSKAVA